MRTAYLNLARLLALLVVIQAMTAVFAMAGLFHWITEQGGVLDDSVYKSWEENHPTFTGAIGIPIHTQTGQIVIPVVALLLLIVAFFAKVPRGVAMAVVIIVLVALQILAGMNASHIPYLGLWHGVGALLIFGSAIGAAMAAKQAKETAAV
jgi:hypothetical protein